MDGSDGATGGVAPTRPGHELASGLRSLGEERSARWTFAAAIVMSLPVFFVVGRKQWFIRDDWAVLVTRRRWGVDNGPMTEYFTAQDGHWMTVPVAIYRIVEAMFGLESYWPFLAPVLVVHIVSVVLLRVICRRVGASPWTSTVLCSVVLLLGGGWENIVFAVQITYNLTLLAFLIQLLLVDHGGRIDWRDVVGSALAVVGTASSGFGPFYVFGIALLLVLRRRWWAAVVASAPSAIAYAWWWMAYGGDRAADESGRPLGRLPAFVSLGFDSTFRSLVPVASLSGIALVGVVWVIVRRTGRTQAHDVVIAMLATATVMFVGVGVQRVGVAINIAASSRYVYMAAFLVVPALAVAIDDLRLAARELHLAALLLVAAAVPVQAGQLVISGSDWAARAQQERRELSLIAGASLPDDVVLEQPCLAFSPDVRCADVDELVSKGAIAPMQPVTDADRAFVAGLADGVVVEPAG